MAHADATNRGLGRLYVPDARDQGYRMAALLSTDTSAVRTRIWSYPKVRLDQGNKPHCVEYAFRHRFAASPVRQQLDLPLGEFYRRAQRVDEWPGEDYAGTSVRAGAKIALELGLIRAYHWADDLPTVRSYVCHDGPVVVGTDWTEAMFRPDAEGYLSIDGGIVGGHAYLLIGYSVARAAFRILNSWGPSFGQNGAAWLRERDMGTLLGRWGEAVAPVEVKR